jgi:VanZ family protein
MLYTKFNTNVRRGLLALAFLFAVIIVLKSLTPAIPVISITNIDKAVHMSAYLALGMITLPAFADVKPFIVWCGLSVFGASVEIAQGLMNTGRSADVLDGVANATGAMLAVIVWVLLSKFSRNYT